MEKAPAVDEIMETVLVGSRLNRRRFYDHTWRGKKAGKITAQPRSAQALQNSGGEAPLCFWERFANSQGRGSLLPETRRFISIPRSSLPFRKFHAFKSATVWSRPYRTKPQSDQHTRLASWSPCTRRRRAGYLISGSGAVQRFWYGWKM